MEPNNTVDANSKNTDGKPGLKRVADILTRFLRWRPTMTDLQDRNIIKGNVDATKSALERNETKKKLATLFGQYATETSSTKLTYPQFGIDPTALEDMYPDQPLGIPRVLSACFAYLEKHLHFEGLFRVTGSHIQITTLRISVENGNYDVITKCLAPQTITGMVSLWFRQLPQPLIPYALFKQCMEIGAMASEQEKIDALRILMQEKLPPANYRIMITFMRLLKKIAQNAAANLMNASNLGLVWGPTLMQDEDPMSSMVGDNLTRSNNLVELMIAQYETIFPHDPSIFTAISPPGSPIPQRPGPPTLQPTSPISPRARNTLRSNLTRSADSVGSDSPPSPLTSRPNNPSPIVTPSRPVRVRPPLGVITEQTPIPPPAPPPMPSHHNNSEPSPSPANPPPRPKLPASSPISVASSSSPSTSPTSTSSPSFAQLASSPSTPVSPGMRPPRPPRFISVSNLALSGDLPPTRQRGSTMGASLERYESSPQLIPTTDNNEDTTTESKAELSTSPIRRTIGMAKGAPKVRFDTSSPKLPPKPARPPPPAPPGERMRAETYV